MPAVTSLFERCCTAARRTLRVLRLRSDQTDVVFGCSHISQPVLGHLACCPGLRRLGISSAELMSVDLGALRHLIHLEVIAKSGCSLPLPGAGFGNLGLP
jgi:hypothetical protein